MESTLLSPGRAYRCAKCGAVFRYARSESVSADAEPISPAGFARRLVQGVVVVAIIMVGGWFMMDQYAPPLTLAIVTATSMLGFVVLATFMRKRAADAAGFSGALMLTVSMATLSLVFLSDSVPEDREQGLMLIIMALGALGGTQFARWIRNRVGLPNVGPDGLEIVNESADHEEESPTCSSS